MSETLRLRDQRLEWVDTGAEIIALDGERDTYMAGNEATKALWPLLVRGTTRGELVDRLVANFQIDAGVASVDIDAFVASLEQKGLLAAP